MAQGVGILFLLSSMVLPFGLLEGSERSRVDGSGCGNFACYFNNGSTFSAFRVVGGAARWRFRAHGCR